MKTLSRPKRSQRTPARGGSGKARKPARPLADALKARPGTPPELRATAAPAASPDAGGPAAYLYGIAQWPLPWATSPEAIASSVGPGVGDPPRGVTAVVHRDLAALVSQVHASTIGSGQDVRGLRRDMCAHANVLNRIVALGGTVLPAAFRLVFPQADLLASRFLQPQYNTLAAHAARLEDSVEVTLKVAYLEAQAIRDVVAESPQLAQAMGRRAQSLDSKIELGRRVAQALRAKRDRDARHILNGLTGTVRDAKLSEPAADTLVLNASFLVPRKLMGKFDRALEEVNRAAKGRMQFDCVGPLPPYSFVDLRL